MTSLTSRLNFFSTLAGGGGTGGTGLGGGRPDDAADEGTNEGNGNANANESGGNGPMISNLDSSNTNSAKGLKETRGAEHSQGMERGVERERGAFPFPSQLPPPPPPTTITNVPSGVHHPHPHSAPSIPPSPSSSIVSPISPSAASPLSTPSSTNSSGGRRKATLNQSRLNSKNVSGSGSDMTMTGFWNGDGEGGSGRGGEVGGRGRVKEVISNSSSEVVADPKTRDPDGREREVPQISGGGRSRSRGGSIATAEKAGTAGSGNGNRSNDSRRRGTFSSSEEISARGIELRKSRRREDEESKEKVSYSTNDGSVSSGGSVINVLQSSKSNNNEKPPLLSKSQSYPELSSSSNRREKPSSQSESHSRAQSTSYPRPEVSPPTPAEERTLSSKSKSPRSRGLSRPTRPSSKPTNGHNHSSPPQQPNPSQSSYSYPSPSSHLSSSVGSNNININANIASLGLKKSRSNNSVGNNLPPALQTVDVGGGGGGGGGEKSIYFDERVGRELEEMEEKALVLDDACRRKSKSGLPSGDDAGGGVAREPYKYIKQRSSPSSGDDNDDDYKFETSPPKRSSSLFISGSGNSGSKGRQQGLVAMRSVKGRAGKKSGAGLESGVSSGIGSIFGDLMRSDSGRGSVNMRARFGFGLRIEDDEEGDRDHQVGEGESIEKQRQRERTALSIALDQQRDLFDPLTPSATFPSRNEIRTPSSTSFPVSPSEEDESGPGGGGGGGIERRIRKLEEEKEQKEARGQKMTGDDLNWKSVDGEFTPMVGKGFSQVDEEGARRNLGIPDDKGKAKPKATKDVGNLNLQSSSGIGGRNPFPETQSDGFQPYARSPFSHPPYPLNITGRKQRMEDTLTPEPILDQTPQVPATLTTSNPKQHSSNLNNNLVIPRFRSPGQASRSPQISIATSNDDDGELDVPSSVDGDGPWSLEYESPVEGWRAGREYRNADRDGSPSGGSGSGTGDSGTGSGLDAMGVSKDLVATREEDKEDSRKPTRNSSRIRRSIINSERKGDPPESRKNRRHKSQTRSVSTVMSTSTNNSVIDPDFSIIDNGDRNGNGNEVTPRSFNGSNGKVGRHGRKGSSFTGPPIQIFPNIVKSGVEVEQGESPVSLIDEEAPSNARTTNHEAFGPSQVHTSPSPIPFSLAEDEIGKAVGGSVLSSIRGSASFLVMSEPGMSDPNQGQSSSQTHLKVSTVGNATLAPPSPNVGFAITSDVVEMAPRQFLNLTPSPDPTPRQDDFIAPPTTGGTAPVKPTVAFTGPPRLTRPRQPKSYHKGKWKAFEESDEGHGVETGSRPQTGGTGEQADVEDNFTSWPLAARPANVAQRWEPPSKNRPPPLPGSSRQHPYAVSNHEDDEDEPSYSRFRQEELRRQRARFLAQHTTQPSDSDRSEAAAFGLSSISTSGHSHSQSHGTSGSSAGKRRSMTSAARIAAAEGSARGGVGIGLGTLNGTMRNFGPQREPSPDPAARGRLGLRPQEYDPTQRGANNNISRNGDTTDYKGPFQFKATSAESPMVGEEELQSTKKGKRKKQVQTKNEPLMSPESDGATSDGSARKRRFLFFGSPGKKGPKSQPPLPDTIRLGVPGLTGDHQLESPEKPPYSSENKTVVTEGKTSSFHLLPGVEEILGQGGRFSVNSVLGNVEHQWKKVEEEIQGEMTGRRSEQNDRAWEWIQLDGSRNERAGDGDQREEAMETLGDQSYQPRREQRADPSRLLASPPASTRHPLSPATVALTGMKTVPELQGRVQGLLQHGKEATTSTAPLSSAGFKAFGKRKGSGLKSSTLVFPESPSTDSVLTPSRPGTRLGNNGMGPNELQSIYKPSPTSARATGNRLKKIKPNHPPTKLAEIAESKVDRERREMRELLQSPQAFQQPAQPKLLWGRPPTWMARQGTVSDIGPVRGTTIPTRNRTATDPLPPSPVAEPIEPDSPHPYVAGRRASSPPVPMSMEILQTVADPLGKGRVAGQGVSKERRLRRKNKNAAQSRSNRIEVWRRDVDSSDSASLVSSRQTSLPDLKAASVLTGPSAPKPNIRPQLRLQTSSPALLGSRFSDTTKDPTPATTNALFTPVSTEVKGDNFTATVQEDSLEEVNAATLSPPRPTKSPLRTPNILASRSPLSEFYPGMPAFITTEHHLGQQAARVREAFSQQQQQREREREQTHERRRSKTRALSRSSSLDSVIDPHRPSIRRGESLKKSQKRPATADDTPVRGIIPEETSHGKRRTGSGDRAETTPTGREDSSPSAPGSSLVSSNYTMSSSELFFKASPISKPALLPPSLATATSVTPPPGQRIVLPSSSREPLNSHYQPSTVPTDSNDRYRLSKVASSIYPDEEEILPPMPQKAISTLTSPTSQGSREDVVSPTGTRGNGRGPMLKPGQAKALRTRLYLNSEEQVDGEVK